MTITQRAAQDSPVWRINYGPQAATGRRGGDLIVDVDAGDARIQRVWRGQ